MRSQGLTILLPVLLLAGCDSSLQLGDNPSPDAQAGADASADGNESAMDGSKSDAAAKNDGGGTDSSNTDGAGSSDASGTDGPAQGPCTAGTHQCGSGGSIVEVCNSNGTAWLYSSSCMAGCSAGLCTGACQVGQQRCNGNNVEACNASGTAWEVKTACTTSCSTLGGGASCALSALNITTNTNLDGIVVVTGDVTVYDGATLTSPAGNLTLYANNIIVQSTGAIVMTPTGQTEAGDTDSSMCGGGYGSPGNPYTPQDPGWCSDNIFGSQSDSTVQPGGAGASGSLDYAMGGGVLRLFASGTISIEGQVHADGGSQLTSSSGGSGGGILLAANSVEIAGGLSAAGGAGNTDANGGGCGRIKVLYGSTQSVTGTLGAYPCSTNYLLDTVALLPPIPVTSTSHPDPTLIYNDDFPTFDFSWNTPFASAQGAYASLTQGTETVPIAATGQFLTNNYISYPQSAMSQGGTFYFNIVPVDATSTLGQVETAFAVRVNATPPTVTSTTHPSQTGWSTNTSPLFSWTFPIADSMLTRSYYVIDHYGLTVPDTSATLVPVSQKQLLLSGVASGVWVMHVVSVDSRGYFTKQAGHYRINVGADPGSGSIVGQVLDASAHPVSGAIVTVNRGLYTQTTDGTGHYNFGAVPSGAWEVDATNQGQTVTESAMVTTGNVATVNLAF